MRDTRNFERRTVASLLAVKGTWYSQSKCSTAGKEDHPTSTLERFESCLIAAQLGSETERIGILGECSVTRCFHSSSAGPTVA